MKVCDVIDYYKPIGVRPNQARSGAISAAATALGLKRQAVWKWTQRKDGMVPPLSAARLHDLTRGKLRFDPDEYAGWYDNSKSPAPCTDAA